MSSVGNGYEMRLPASISMAISHFGRLLATSSSLLQLFYLLAEGQMHPLDYAKEGDFKCGVLGPAADTYVVGGQIVRQSKYPWLASVICMECASANPWNHICGGSLITDR